MQRQAYGPGPANSPPLHHPVPQHVSTVPMMRSPPPPASSAGNGYDTPYGGNMQQGTPAANFGQGFGGFMNDPTAQMGVKMGQTAFNAGQEYMERNLQGYVSVGALKGYFNVTTSYVLRKLFLVMWPWQHKPWSRQQRPSAAANQDPASYTYSFLPPREDINSPDMYIPVMAIVTYILLSTLLAGLRGAFHPEVMGSTFAYAMFVVVAEIVILKLGTYFLSITSESQLLDLVAYSGYKFVGVIVTLTVSETVNLGQGTGGWIGWGVFIYTYLANAFFLLRSLKYVLLPDASGPVAGANPVTRSLRNRRTQFLFLYSYAFQLMFMWVLSHQEAPVQLKVG